MSDLGPFEAGFAGHRRVLASLRNPEAVLVAFTNAAHEVARYVSKGLDRAIAADQLIDMATTYGLTDMDLVQDIVSQAFVKIRKVKGTNGGANGAAPHAPAKADLDTCNMGKGYVTHPRQWLLGNQFCRGFISSIVAAGGTGKTALRMLQFVSLALGEPLCGQHIFRRSRVLVLNFEDDQEEMHRRLKAILDFYGLDRARLDGWLWSASPKRSKLAYSEKRNRRIGPLVEQIQDKIEELQPDLVSLDPFVKTHSLEENDSGDMDFVCELLAHMASKYNIAIDSPHHVHKGIIEPGDADSGRGSSGIKDAARLVYTLCPMSIEQAQQYGIDPGSRWSYVRLDQAKVNISTHSGRVTWFRLCSQNIGNGDADYPQGDNVQVVEPWAPPDAWSGTTIEGLNKILTAIEAGTESGQRYSNAPSTGDDRQVWRIVREHYPEKSEAECRRVIHAWLDSGLLYSKDYDDPVQRKPRKGLFVNAAKRPS